MFEMDFRVVRIHIDFDKQFLLIKWLILNKNQSS